MFISLVEPKPPSSNYFKYFKFPRLGLPLLGTILSQHGHQVTIYSHIVEKISPRDYINIFNSQLVGISLTTSTANAGYRLASAMRVAKVPVVFGGTHPTFFPEEALNYGDYVLRGEAEKSILQLIKALEGELPLDAVEGLSFKREGEVIHNPMGERPKNLDELPIPDFSLMRGQHRMHIIPMATSRGCPYHCNFCSVTDMFGHRYRFQSVERIIEELKLYRGRGVFFYDDNFTANVAHTKELLNEMTRQNMQITWSAQVRADVARDRELLDLMKHSGCLALFIGFESVNPETLQEYNKAQELADIALCITELNRRKIRIHGMFVLGSDADDLNTIRQTVEFAKKTDIGTIQFSALTPLPGTKFYHQLEEENRIFTKDWDLYDGQHVVFEPKKMSPIELQQGILQATANFYSYWRIFAALRKRKLATAVFRYWGHLIIKKWTHQRKEFLGMLTKRSAQLKDWSKLKRPRKHKTSRPPRTLWKVLQRLGTAFK